MIPFLPQRESAMVSAVLLGLGLLTARWMLPSVARFRAFRVAAALVVAVDVTAHVAWELAPTYPIRAWSANVAEITLCLVPLLLASVPLAALMRALAKRALRVGEAATAETSETPRATLTRRAVLGAATSLAPVVALGTGASGFAQSDTPPRIPRVTFTYPDLPPALEGLRILQLSDLHLGLDRHVEDLEALLDRVRGERPDLVVFTGDAADDVRELDPALRAAVALNPRLGVYASLGNHEYLHGVESSLAVYAKRRDVRLLVGAGERVRVGSGELFLAGSDDPMYTHLDPTPFLERSIAAALASAPAGAFRVLLSHRPEGFVPAAARGVELVLSGHTHGGQIGFNGKSAFQPIWPEKYLWGPYSRGGSRLYTTSGFGHWFPFRFLCPTEAPIIVLARGA